MAKKSSLLKALCFVLLSILCTAQLIAQNIKVTGTVSDKFGPIIGATVKVKGTTNGATTDLNGNFTLPSVSPKATLVFSYVGYQTKEVPVNGKTVFKIDMVEDSKQLDEVVVVAVGYGEVKRRDLTGSIAQANMKDLTLTPVTNIASSLGGRVAGVRVSSSDGGLGDNYNFVIRGAGSLTQSTAPLFIIDGFPSEASGMSALNPNDIASIDVLKDASATAIYGSRGANGVVIVTTKSGKAGKPTVTYDGSVTISTIRKKMDLMNGYDYVLLQRDIMEGSTIQKDNGDTVPLFDYRYLADGFTLDTYKDIKSYDWQDEIYRTAVSQNHYVSLSGGSDKMKYSSSLSYTDQNGIIINTSLKRYQGRFNFNQTVNKNLKVNANANFASTVQNGQIPTNSTSSMTNALMYSVWGFRPVSPKGDNLLDEMYDNDVDMKDDYRFNPVLTAKNEFRQYTTNHLQANLGVEWQIIKNLKFKTTAGYTGRDIKREEFNGPNTRTGNSNPKNTQSRGINARLMQQEIRRYVNENTLSYKYRKRKHSLDTMLGLTLEKESAYYSDIITEFIPNESLGMSGIGKGSKPSTVNSGKGENTLLSYYGRIYYNYASKYYANFTMRADGSSKFASGNRWGYFPSGSLAWAFAREKFISDNLPWMNTGKLRVSYGLTGNNRIGNYDYMAQLITDADKYKYPWDGTFTTGFVMSSMANKALKWETTHQFDLGLDLGFLNGRINLNMDYYIKKTKDLLLNADVPGSSGYSTAILNVGELKNTGFELTLSTTNIQKKGFKWTSDINFAYNNNEIIALNRGQESMINYIPWDIKYRETPAYISRIGESAGSMYGYIYEGTYKYDDFDVTQKGDKTIYTLKEGIPAVGNTVQPGDPKYRDLNGDGKINEKDFTIIGHGQPKFTGGFTNNFTYKNWDLNIFLQWSLGNDILNANRMVFENPMSKQNTNMFASYNNRWTPDNPNSNMPRAKAIGSDAYSSLYVENGSFLKLKNITLSYNFLPMTLHKLGIRAAKLYVSAENIATLTNYKGSDPEVSTRNGVLTPGFDWSAYPRAFNASLGMNITF